MTKKFNNNSGVYKIINTINNKFYIGSSKTLAKRLSNHKHKLNKNIHGNIHLQRAWNMYGKENFLFVVIELCPNYFEREQYWLDFYQCYNSDIGYNKKDVVDAKVSKINKPEIIKEPKDHGNKGKRFTFIKN